ncbi:hypothetical protein IF188_10730 [Microbacterium sp. NEAU-LLC]|uniref:Uncharacterized protein n=1 Tax=Microbacterium helvum TaxID=2773713 RepID=A0ABR8NQY1_9MICO|nr:hypothetical protein [Microbacterium helvum]MBD3942172.1 hypothetical protein [Microbacterium helvum]
MSEERMPAAGAEPQKRPAYEPAARLLRPVPHDPGMKRPASTVAGAVLVLLRAMAGLLVGGAIAVAWQEILGDPDVELALDGVDVGSADARQIALWIVLGIAGLSILLDVVFAVFVLRGSNAARIAVMVISVLSISAAFFAWWVQGQEIRVDETFASLALDILVLLALSSRSASAYARRNEAR